MTAEEFNKKYREFCESGFEDFGPLEFDILEVTEFLNTLFENILIHIPDFKVAQIKLKFGNTRFYSSLDFAVNNMIEREIDRAIKFAKSDKPPVVDRKNLKLIDL